MHTPAAKKLRKATLSHGIAPHSTTLTGNSGPVSVFFISGELTGKERDPETGLYYYGARYLDPRTSRWISADPAMWEGDYIPSAPINDQARERNQNLPGMGGIFNYVNFHVYHYGGNNPVKLTDPDGRQSRFTPTLQLQFHQNDTLVPGAGTGGGGGGGSLTGAAAAIAYGIARTVEAIATEVQNIMESSRTRQTQQRQGERLANRSQAAAPSPVQPPQNDNNENRNRNENSQSARDAKPLEDRQAERFARDRGFNDVHELKEHTLRDAGAGSRRGGLYDVVVNNRTGEAFLRPKPGNPGLVHIPIP